MPTFVYRAMGTDGREVRGELEAGDTRAAASALRGRSLYVLQLKAQSARSPGAPAGRRGGGAGVSAAAANTDLPALLSGLTPVRSRDRVAFFRQLALMQRSGLTLLEGLRVVRKQTRKPVMAKAIDRVMDAIQNGRTFSGALDQERRVFPLYAVKLVESAEASGELDVVLERVASFVERQAQLRASLVTSLTYPAIVTVVSLAVAGFLVVKIIPRFSVYLAQRDVALPWAAQWLMGVSGWLQANGAALGIAAVAALAALAVAWFWEPGRRVLDRLVLRVPIVGGLLVSGAMATLGRTLGMLLRSGVSLIDSLRITRQLIGNRTIARRLEDAADQVLSGRDLAGALEHPALPAAVTQVVAVGEQTGSLSEVLEELGAYYDNALQAAIKRMSTLIEPAMILILGGMVGFVYFAFFQAVFRLATAGV